MCALQKFSEEALGITVLSPSLFFAVCTYFVSFNLLQQLYVFICRNYNEFVETLLLICKTILNLQQSICLQLVPGPSRVCSWQLLAVPITSFVHAGNHSFPPMKYGQVNWVFAWSSNALFELELSCHQHRSLLRCHYLGCQRKFSGASVAQCPK